MRVEMIYHREGSREERNKANGTFSFGTRASSTAERQLALETVRQPACSPPTPTPTEEARNRLIPRQRACDVAFLPVPPHLCPARRKLPFLTCCYVKVVVHDIIDSANPCHAQIRATSTHRPHSNSTRFHSESTVPHSRDSRSRLREKTAPQPQWVRGIQSFEKALQR